MKKSKRDPIIELAEIIKANPKCFAIVDNDCWTLYKSDPNGLDEEDSENIEIASSSTHSFPFGGYGSGNEYGGDLLQALALIVGIKVESV